MRTLSKVIIGIVIFGLLGLAGFGFGFVTVRSSWPQVDGTMRADGLRAKATIVRHSG